MYPVNKVKFSINNVKAVCSYNGLKRVFIFALFFTVFIFSIVAKAAANPSSALFLNHVQVQQDQQIPEMAMPSDLLTKEECKGKTNNKSCYLSYFILYRLNDNGNILDFTLIHNSYYYGTHAPAFYSPLFIRNHNFRI